MSNIQASWQSLEAWLAENVPSLADALPGPTSGQAIQAIEKRIGFAFPADLKESYLTQNGVEYGEGELNIFPGLADEMAFCLLPIEQIGDEWKIWKELIDDGDFDDAAADPDTGIDEVWWSEGWIPVAGNGCGDFICVDMKPSSEGSVGQVIYAPHDMDERKLIAPSWAAYLQLIVKGVESGALTYDEDEGLIYV
ncbi:SMI1/KNR4 family protein [Aeoliella mucimassa]|uniref:SMI1 / KNR4 family protein n=1 Tax=Aeoliella mucimassa TaxID=2527972 RepID=A0A518AT57_9BACT|nr:SMI1/KNR4 family protein [Aeoliella mucimassa]QDU57901.1 SMI1 / KNR4 family protein [Aeoliella mucimassa]